ncbi:MAG: response regulator transcription factor [Chloroflexi bacterium]|nr:response regulator transcription factor [Chloroflexota bacterium]
MEQTLEMSLTKKQGSVMTSDESTYEVRASLLPKNSNGASSLGTKKIQVCIVEEQEILRHAYTLTLPLEAAIELAGVSGTCDAEDIMNMISTLNPDVLVLGMKVLDPGTIDLLDTIRQHFPDLGIVVLATSFDDLGMNRLKEFTKVNPRGCAFLLKQSIDRAGQLAQLIQAVATGQIVLDSLVMEKLIEGTDVRVSLLKDLTRRELDVVSCLAKGYRNETIGNILGVDRKTVERHINCVYSKLGHVLNESKQPRVSTAILYLEATGQLLINGVLDE